jgi:hypothetical protein
MTTIIENVAGKATLDRKAVITLALLYFVRDDYPDEEEPYVKVAKDLLRTEFGVPAHRAAELDRIVRGAEDPLPDRVRAAGPRAAPLPEQA